MEHSSRYFLDRGDGLRCRCYRDCPLELHAGLQVMSAERLAIDIDSGTFRDIVEVPQCPILHFDNQIVA